MKHSISRTIFTTIAGLGVAFTVFVGAAVLGYISWMAPSSLLAQDAKASDPIAQTSDPIDQTNAASKSNTATFALRNSNQVLPATFTPPPMQNTQPGLKDAFALGQQQPNRAPYSQSRQSTVTVHSDQSVKMNLELINMQKRLGKQHPEVIALRKTLSQVEKLLPRYQTASTRPQGLDSLATRPSYAYPTKYYSANASDREINPLVKEYLATEDAEEKEKVAQQIEAMLSKVFDEHLEAQRDRYTEMEEKLEKIKSQLEKRESARDEVIGAKLKNILDTADGLGWPTDHEQATLPTFVQPEFSSNNFQPRPSVSVRRNTTATSSPFGTNLARGTLPATRPVQQNRPDVTARWQVPSAGNSVATVPRAVANFPANSNGSRRETGFQRPALPNSAPSSPFASDLVAKGPEFSQQANNETGTFDDFLQRRQPAQSPYTALTNRVNSMIQTLEGIFPSPVFEDAFIRSLETKTARKLISSRSPDELRAEIRRFKEVWKVLLEESVKSANGAISNGPGPLSELIEKAGDEETCYFDNCVIVSAPEAALHLHKVNDKWFVDYEKTVATFPADYEAPNPWVPSDENPGLPN